MRSPIESGESGRRCLKGETMMGEQGERPAAVVLAAGQGKRMQSGVATQYLLLKERPVIW